MFRKCVLSLLGCLILALGACSSGNGPNSGSATSVPATPTSAPQTLVMVYSHGGLMLDPVTKGGVEFKSWQTIDRNGAARRSSVAPGANGAGHAAEVQLPQGDVAQLALLITQADFARIRATPFTGLCPTAVDATETVITFYTATGTEVVASCTTAINWDDPLFKLL